MIFVVNIFSGKTLFGEFADFSAHIVGDACEKIKAAE